MKESIAKDPPLEPEEGIRSFAAFVRDATDGQIERDASLEFWGLLAKLKQTFDAHGGTPKGKLTLTVEPSYDGKQLMVGHSLTITQPKQPRAKAVAWLTPGGNYSFVKKEKQLGLFAVEGPKVAEGPPAPAVIQP
jgi:hypothetical protein